MAFIPENTNWEQHSRIRTPGYLIYLLRQTPPFCDNKIGVSLCIHARPHSSAWHKTPSNLLSQTPTVSMKFGAEFRMPLTCPFLVYLLSWSVDDAAVRTRLGEMFLKCRLAGRRVYREVVHGTALQGRKVRARDGLMERLVNYTQMTTNKYIINK